MSAQCQLGDIPMFFSTGTLFLALLSACGREGDITLKIEPEIKPYLDYYLERAPNHGRLGRLTDVQFGIPQKGMAGECAPSGTWGKGPFESDPTYTVTVLRPAEFDIKFKALMMHELGHCLHGKGHVDDPDALMSYHPLDKSEEFWTENLDQKIADMFKENG